MLSSKKDFESTFEYKLIYVFRVNDEKHSGCLKIGDATVHTKKDYTKLVPNCSELNFAARKRIDEYTATAGICYDLLHTEVAVYKLNKPGHKNHGKVLAFRDYQVHEVLKRSGVKKKRFDTNANEWFVCKLTTAIDAIKAVKENKTALTSAEVENGKSPIVFRPEQAKAIKDTIKCFKAKDRMLWNAKMRFGKTLSALQVAKEKGFKKTIIITHRPVVEDGWFDDFDKIFYDKPDYSFGSKTKGKTINELISSNNSFVYFASMQDLRGSSEVGGNFDKNKEVFDLDWDFVVVDEAHEGTQTSLGKSVLEKVIKPEKTNHKTYVLELSGTPFNLLTDFESDSIYTWDYIMEQEAKMDWAKNHFGDSNPYEELPKMNIFTYHLEDTLKAYIDIEDKAFNFREFFRIWTGDIKKDFTKIPKGQKIGDFVHEKDINSFLDLICKDSAETNYPYSTEEYRAFFRHTLWVVPGVKEAKALSELLKKHHVFQHFKVVNVAGEGDEEIDTSDALSAVRLAMTNDPDSTYTITLSCGRLTTGVSVPEWTAVLMLAGSYSTAASQYLQTIFRVQTPANINGKMKENCYVFDFAPDRTLKMIAESVQLSARAGETQPSAEIQLGKFLNFCPVISIDDTGMKEYKVAYLLQELKKAYAERVAKNGFDDTKLYNDELLKLDEIELKEFEKLKAIVGSQASQPSTGEIDINNTGLTEEQREEIEKIKKKPKKERTPEEIEKLKELREKRKNRQSAISILRAISIRIPLLIYGIDKDIDYDITIDSFADSALIDDNSWNEFMPKGVTREMFQKFSKYYDKDIFVAAGRRIRAISKSADELPPTERVQKIASLFGTFKNPDKETVLTPWRVVNMHMSDTVGGYDFFNENHSEEIDEPRLVERSEITKKVFDKDSTILEINSKTGLYPLYVVYSIYRSRCNGFSKEELTFDKQQQLWDKTCKENVFVICKTPMAKQITKRTLVGYRSAKANMHAFDDLVMQLKEKQSQFIQKISKRSFWGLGGNENMNFNAIVGNPPYQLMDGGAQSSSTPIYNLFVDASKKIKPDYVSLIMPSRWMTGGKGLDDFRSSMIHDKSIRILHDYYDEKDCFNNVDIKGGVCYFLWDKSYKQECDVYTHSSNGEIKHSKRFLAVNDEATFFVRDAELVDVLGRVSSKHLKTFDSMVSSRKPYGLTGDFFKDPSKYKLPKISDTKIDGGISILGLGEKQKRIHKYVGADYPFPKKDGLDEIKVFIPESFGSGTMGEGPTSPVIAGKNCACTETFLEIRPVDSKETAENIVAYMRTKFFRVLVGVAKNTQHGTQKVYSLVPVVDFKKKWTDEELFEFFGLSESQRAYINDLIAE